MVREAGNTVPSFRTRRVWKSSNGWPARIMACMALPSPVRPYWNQERGGLADDLLARVAVHPLRGLVPARDVAFERPADNGNTAVLDYRRQPGQPGVLPVHFRVTGHIAHRRDHQQAAGRLHVGQGNVHRERAAIPPTSAQVQIDTHGPRLWVFDIILTLRLVD